MWTEEELHLHHEKEKKNALHTFQDLTKSGGVDDKKEERRKHLNITIDESFAKFSSGNKVFEVNGIIWRKVALLLFYYNNICFRKTWNWI